MLRHTHLGLRRLFVERRESRDKTKQVRAFWMTSLDTPISLGRSLPDATHLLSFCAFEVPSFSQRKVHSCRVPGRLEIRKPGPGLQSSHRAFCPKEAIWASLSTSKRFALVEFHPHQLQDSVHQCFRAPFGQVANLGTAQSTVSWLVEGFLDQFWLGPFVATPFENTQNTSRPAPMLVQRSAA